MSPVFTTLVRHPSPAVSWWLEPTGDGGWRYVVAGSNWLRQSATHPSAYDAQRAALAVFAEAAS